MLKTVESGLTQLNQSLNHNKLLLSLRDTLVTARDLLVETNLAIKTKIEEEKRKTAGFRKKASDLKA